MSGEKRTIDQMKKLREVPAEARERVKEYTKIRKSIKTALSEEPATILEIAEKTGLRPERVTYYLMTMMKFGEIDTIDDDDVDDYYCYQLKE